jgi:hypothetical protein
MCTDNQDEAGWTPPIGPGAAMAHGCCGGRGMPQAPAKSATVIPIIARRSSCAGSCDTDSKATGGPSPAE